MYGQEMMRCEHVREADSCGPSGSIRRRFFTLVRWRFGERADAFEQSDERETLPMYQSSLAALLAGSIALANATQALGQPMCKPALVIKEAQLSAMLPPSLAR
jgi:hypothetical protein